MLNVFLQVSGKMGSTVVRETIMDGKSVLWMMEEWRKLQETDPEYYTWLLFIFLMAQ